MRCVNKTVDHVNKPSLQQQIDFLNRELERCKIVYRFLQREYGHKRIHLVNKEILDQVFHYKAIIKSLKELQNLKSKKHES